MHAKEELDRAILNLYKDYKDTIKDYKDDNLKFLYDVNKINNEERKYNEKDMGSMPACHDLLSVMGKRISMYQSWI